MILRAFQTQCPWLNGRQSIIDQTMMNSPGSPQPDSATVKPLWQADVSLLLVALVWGVNIPVMKVALLRIDGYAFNAIRLIVSSIVLLHFARREFVRGIRPTTTLSIRNVLIYAFTVSVAYQLLFLLAVSRATSGDVALIMATVPMWTAIGARVFLKEILPWLAWGGLIVAFAGTMIVTLQKTPTSPATSHAGNVTDQTNAEAAEHANKAAQRLTGNIFALSAALAWAGGTVFSRPLLGKISPMQLSASSATLGLPIHIAIALMFGQDSMAATAAAIWNPSAIGCILYSGTLSTGLALAMWSYGVKHAGAAHAAMIQNLTPIVAMAAAGFWLGEKINMAQAVGGAMIIGGLFIMRWSRHVRVSRNV